MALVYTFLKEAGHTNIDYYIPDRYREGYGISYPAINYAAENGFKLVIALDCGIKAVEKIKKANELGVDFIVCDHHRPDIVLPPAVAVLDSKRPDCDYPFKELSGCGVGFKLIQALAQKRAIDFNSITKYLDLVVVSIAADIVPITGENRILAYYGLKAINSNPRAGFEAILKFSNIIRQNDKQKDLRDKQENKCIFNRELSISDLVFLVGPRINAAGRIESGRNSVKLLISETIQEAEEIGIQINDFNTTRRDLDGQTTEMALEQIKTEERLKNSRTTVVYNEQWHKGVVGIVASRLVETYYRPTIVLTRSNGLVSGSARSIKNFDIYNAIDECSDLLEHFGGHTYAAGLAMKEENLKEFIERFESIGQRELTDEMMIPEVEVDLCINLDSINSKFYRILKQFAPFGPGNMAPVFKTENVYDSGSGRIVGKNHLKLMVYHKQISSQPFPCIAFQQGHHDRHIRDSRAFNICYHIEENDFNNKKTLQLNIKDMMVLAENELQGETPGILKNE
ncbi:Single-stranded-DNA-specific exonuclease RecJ [anaerobic digester metagenome]